MFASMVCIYVKSRLPADTETYPDRRYAPAIPVLVSIRAAKRRGALPLQVLPLQILPLQVLPLQGGTIGSNLKVSGLGSPREP